MYVVKNGVSLEEFKKFGFVSESDGSINFLYKPLLDSFGNLCGRIFVQFFNNSQRLCVFFHTYKYYVRFLSDVVELYLDLINAGLIEKFGK